jgi:hypothetical protein
VPVATSTRTPRPTSTPQPTNNGTTSPQFTPAQIALEANTNFEVRVSNPDVAQAAGVRYVIEYDPAIITCDDRAAGNPAIPPQPFTFTILPNGCNNGRYEFVGNIQGTRDTIALGDVVRVIFRTRAQVGTTSLTLTEAEYLDRNGQPIATLAAPVDLPVTVTSDTITGVASCQAGTNRTLNLFASTDDGTGTPTSFTTILSGARYTLAAPRVGNPYSVIATCSCHVPARRLGIQSPATNQNAQLLGGDVDGNQQINILDIIGIARRFNQPPGDLACADLDQDGTVTFSDLTVAQANFGTERFLPFNPVLQTLAVRRDVEHATTPPLATPIAQPQQTATVSCRVEDATEPGTGTLIVEAANVDDLYGFSFALASDPTVDVPGDTLTPGQFVSPDIEVLNRVIDGTLELAISQQGAIDGVSGAGELGRATIAVPQAGTYTFTFTDGMLGTSAGAEHAYTTEGCTFTADEAATTPEPPDGNDSTLYLPLLR